MVERWAHVEGLSSSIIWSVKNTAPVPGGAYGTALKLEDPQTRSQAEIIGDEEEERRKVKVHST